MIRTTDDILELLLNNPDTWIHTKYCLNIEDTVKSLMSVLDIMGIYFVTYPFFISDLSRVKYVIVPKTQLKDTSKIGDAI